MTGFPADPWTVAIHGGAKLHEPIGAGLVVDTNLVLTCEHVVYVDEELRDDLWVSFPKAGVGYWDRRRVGQCLHNGRQAQNLDLVLLELVEPVPPAVTPARLKCLPQKALLNRAWWAYGFPQHTEGGCAAYGSVSGTGGWGRVHLMAESTPGVVKGFSGGPLWSADYGAVVGVVVSAEPGGNAQALTFGHVDELLPEMKLATFAGWRAEDADDAALAAWGWMLSSDGETTRHWSPRSRGVTVDAEGGWRFRGRGAALRRLRSWLDRADPAGRPMVLTGSPGVGKSAVLGRLVMTADPGITAALPSDDTAERATVGSVACAVHAKGKSALEVATEIARAAGIGLPSAPVDVVPALRDRLALRPARFNLVVDALDEASTPEQSRRLVNDVLLPLARTGLQTGVQVVVGTRRSDDMGDLMAGFGPDADVVDLDTEGYFAEEDLVDYVWATLQMLGDERFGNPYANPVTAAPVARRIAELARGNFLVAGLVARSHALRDSEPADPSAIDFTGEVADALESYLAWLPPAGGASARLALTALAYAETPGLPVSLWQVATQALGGTVTDAQLQDFARTSAANFLVETGGAEEPIYRLFHQALNDALLGGRGADQAGSERQVVHAWVAAGQAAGWSTAPDYLLRLLPGHAARVGLLDDLLGDDDYLLYAHLDHLLRVAEPAVSDLSRARAHLLIRTPRAFGAGPGERAAMFSVVDRLDGLKTGMKPTGAPYYARWARTPPRLERTVLEGHSQAVYDVCPIVIDRRPLLASAGEDGTVRLWDPRTNQSEQTFSCHEDCVRGICAVEVGGETLLATASHDSTVSLWDPLTGLRVQELRGHDDWVRNICTVPRSTGDLVVSASDDGTVRVWDPLTGAQWHALRGHSGWVTAVTYVPVGDHGMIASTGYDGTVRLWDPITGAALHRLIGHVGWATTLYAVSVGGRVLLASAGYDGKVRLWDPLTGTAVRDFDTGSGPLTDLCTIGDRLASTGEDGAIRIWNLQTGAQESVLRGHLSWIRAVCELRLDDRNVLATAGDDGTVRLWDPDGGLPDPISRAREIGAVTALCAVPTGGEVLLASAGSDGRVRLWDPQDGAQRSELSGNAGSVQSICTVDDGYIQLAAANDDGTVRLWDVESGDCIMDMTEHFDAVNAVCVLDADDGVIMASAGDDVTVRLWKPRTAAVRDGLTGHGDWVTSLAVVNRQGRQSLASADKNGTVRLWDSDGSALWDQHCHPDAVNALCGVTINGEDALVSAGADGVARLWSTDDGRPLGSLVGHVAEVTGVCTMTYGGREVIVSASLDRTVRLWDPRTTRTLKTIPVHHCALSCLFIDGALIVGLDQGLLALVFSSQ